jgi:hypothetical protein
MRTDEIREELLARCIEHGLFTTSAEVDLDEDLVESGRVDSMGLETMHAVIDDVYGVVIPAAVFAVELRTLNRIARYIGEVVGAPCCSRAAAPILERS